MLLCTSVAAHGGLAYLALHILSAVDFRTESIFSANRCQKASSCRRC